MHFIISGLNVTERRQLEQELTDATEQVRRQIGRDLHDILGSALSGLSMLAKSLKDRLQAKGIEEADEMGEVVQIAQDCTDKPRAFSHALAPMGLEDEHLADALAQLCHGQDQISDLHVHFERDREGAAGGS